MGYSALQHWLLHITILPQNIVIEFVFTVNVSYISIPIFFHQKIIMFIFVLSMNGNIIFSLNMYMYLQYM